MGRIVKDPVERRREIMNKASELFLNKGYDKTSVNSIVVELDIAKGTFYHYFKSKEEVLCEILEESVEKYSGGIKKDLNSLTGAGNKMQFLLRKLLIPSNSSDQFITRIEDNENAKMHQMFDKKFYEKFHPILVEIIEEGIKEEIFDIIHPVEITEILLMGVRSFMHIHIPRFNDLNYAKEKLSSIEELFNRVLRSDSREFTFKLFEK
ncbi:MAG TPA: TetR/AcrR family transcriptional regulator [Clostridium sp.]|uniref:TetR/AcrR family transcriptional regulator n=1 Tax=Clostridium sp. TaxID=1506 RepID=UPI002F939614